MRGLPSVLGSRCASEGLVHAERFGFLVGLRTMVRHRNGLLAHLVCAGGWVLLAIALGTSQAGCRTDPAILALERENRDLEDEIYALQDLLDRTQDELEACRRAKSAVAPSGRPEEGAPSAEAPSEAPRITTPQRVPLPVPRVPEPGSGSEAVGSSAPTPPKLPELPKIELPQNPLPPGQIPSTLRGAVPAVEPGAPPRQSEPKLSPKSAPPKQMPPMPPPPPTSPGPAWQSANQGGVHLAGGTVAWLADNRQVRRISLHRVLTGGWNRDASPGDEGLSVLIEPRDAQGRVLPAPAPVVVVLLDPALPGDQVRVAQWNVSAAELLQTYRDAPLAEGFHLRLPWPDQAPRHDRLEVLVRYTTDDGRRLEARLPVHLAVPAVP